MHARLALLSPLVLAGLVLPMSAPPTAYAAETTCQGKVATTTGDTSTLTGTEGDDVIVGSPTTFRIVGLGGNDTICAFNGGGIQAGAGNDSVVVTVRPAFTTAPTMANLGPGDDTYVGSVLDDDLSLVDPADRAGVNTISTGGGDDSVASGWAEEPDRDRIDLGEGNDLVASTLVPGSTAAFVGGPGDNSIGVSNGGLGGGRWTVDLQGGTVGSSSGVTVAASGFTGLSEDLVAVENLFVQGTPRADTVYLSSASADVDVDLGGGADSLDLFRPPTSAHGVLDLGSDRGDAISVAAGRRIAIDLAEKRLDLAAKGRSFKLIGVRDVAVSAADVTVDGDGRANVIRAYGCRIQLEGGAGDDLLQSTPGDFVDVGAFTCAGSPDEPGAANTDVHRTGARLAGQKGADRLLGGSADDVLVGGPGRDRAEGRKGTDRCVAEQKYTCER